MKKNFLCALSIALCLILILPMSFAAGEEPAQIVFSSPVHDLNKTDETVRVGDTVTFGRYPQGADGEAAPIEWTVLDVDEYGYYVLISSCALDAKPYNDEDGDTTWETSSLRGWLNGEFYDAAFGSDERTRIRTTHLVNNNSIYGTPGGNDTDDKVYLLSLDEITQYYGIEPGDHGNCHDEIVCKPTEYAMANGADIYNSDGNAEFADYDGNCAWWLRSPGNGGNNASAVWGLGYVNNNDNNVTHAGNTVRPVVRARKSYAPELTSGSAVGDTVTFGSYKHWQHGEDFSPIEWTVLDIDDEGNYVLISKYALDTKPYNDEDTDTTWETSYLREWLNGEFYDTAFNGDERAKIRTTHLVNNNNSIYGTPGGNDTDDKVYILSLDDITKYFGIMSDGYGDRHDEIVCRPTEYAMANGAYIYDSDGNEEYAKYDGNCAWWLRSPGNGQNRASGVLGTGYINDNDYSVALAGNSVRPVICVKKPYAPELTTDTREGDFVSFGSYPQDANGAKEPIEWQVLAVDEEGYYVLISCSALDAKAYNEDASGDGTWENSSLRKWLEGDFYNTAFDLEERGRIKTTHLTNSDNAFYGTPGGNETDDTVYLLSLDEVSEYYGIEDVYVYSQYEELLCKATGFATAKGASVISGDGAGYDDCCVWWLRSPGFVKGDKIQVSTITERGFVDCYGNSVSYSAIAVRPVVRVFPVRPTVPDEGSSFADASEAAAESEEIPADETAGAVDGSSIAQAVEEMTEQFAAAEETGETAEDYVIGGTVTFGSYPQKANGEAAPIQWTVIGIDKDGYYVLISKYALDAKAYNEAEADITWQKCSLRKWLNGDFYNTAFSSDEQARIKINQLPNSNNPGFGTSGGNSTVDRVYLLSIDEVTEYFGVDYEHYNDAHDELCCKPSEYAVSNSIGIVNADGDVEYIDTGSNCEWWLRSPGDYQYVAATVHCDGHVSLNGRNACRDIIGVRPVVRVRH